MQYGLYDSTEENILGFPEPRDFQGRANESVRVGRKDGHRVQMLAAPTGAGKTYLGLLFCKQALDKGRRAIFVCDRTTLINQTSAAATKYGLGRHGIIQADNPRYNPNLPLQIASAQTLARRGWPEGHLASDLVIVDEAHTQLKAWTDYIVQTQATVVGLSATPFSKGLGKLFTNLINAATMHDLTERGVLVPMRVYSCTKADMAGAATVGGEWSDAAAAERGMEIVGDVVTEWIKYGEGRKTICFGATVAHCEELCAQFVKAGIMAALYTGHTTPEERLSLLEEYTKPDSRLRILISVEALAKGFDVPDVGCVIDCRPLRKSLSTFIQMVGRGARSSPETGKTDFILLDHSGNIIRFAEDFTKVFFEGVGSLDDGEKLDSEIRKEPTDDKPVMKCPSCGFKPFAKRCMSCGFETPVAPTKEHVPGAMQEVVLKKGGNPINKQALYDQCVAYARANSKPEKQNGRAAHLFKDFTGDWPPRNFNPDRVPENTQVTKDVYNAIMRKNIRYAKGAAA